MRHLRVVVPVLCCLAVAACSSQANTPAATSAAGRASSAVSVAASGKAAAGSAKDQLTAALAAVPGAKPLLVDISANGVVATVLVDGKQKYVTQGAGKPTVTDATKPSEKPMWAGDAAKLDPAGMAEQAKAKCAGNDPWHATAVFNPNQTAIVTYSCGKGEAANTAVGFDIAGKPWQQVDPYSADGAKAWLGQLQDAGVGRSTGVNVDDREAYAKLASTPTATGETCPAPTVTTPLNLSAGVLFKQVQTCTGSTADAKAADAEFALSEVDPAKVAAAIKQASEKLGISPAQALFLGVDKRNGQLEVSMLSQNYKQALIPLA